MVKSIRRFWPKTELVHLISRKICIEHAILTQSIYLKNFLMSTLRLEFKLMKLYDIHISISRVSNKKSLIFVTRMKEWSIRSNRMRWLLLADPRDYRQKYSNNTILNLAVQKIEEIHIEEAYIARNRTMDINWHWLKKLPWSTKCKLQPEKAREIQCRRKRYTITTCELEYW